MRTMIVGLTLLHLTLAQNASAQTNTYTPRGYPYDSSVCTGGYQACFNRYLKVGWQSAAASSYCSHACRDYPPARRSK
jgi:hypothetical protein